MNMRQSLPATRLPETPVATAMRPAPRLTAHALMIQATGDHLPLIFDPAYTRRPAIDRAIIDAYLADHESPESRRVLGAAASRLARFGGYADHTTAPWSALLATGLVELRNLMRNAQQVATPLPPATVNLYLTIAKGIAKHAFRMRFIDVDQYTRIKDVQGCKGSRNPRGRALPIAEVATLMQSCLSSDDPLAIRDATIMALAFGCGFRRAELASLTMDSCLLAEGKIKVIGKGDKERTVAMPLRAMQILQQWLDVRSGDPGPLFIQYGWRRIEKTERRKPVLVDGRMQPLCDDRIYRIVCTRAKAAGLAHTTTHDLRRSFATYLLQLDTNIHVVAGLMGHASVETTKIYDRRIADAGDKAIAKIDF